MDPDSRGKGVGNAAKQFAIAMQIPFALVVPVFAGGGIGYLLDYWLHTRFIFMIVFGFLGFGVGLREVLKLANAAEKKNGR
jgi:ATP synthase protein I